MTDPRVQSDGYDRGIIPAETAARKEREGDQYKQLPDQENQSIDTTSGYTVDGEGLINNYAIEPEMYYEEPGDARAKEEEETAKRQQELKEINATNEKGKLTEDGDQRGKGTGVI